MHYFPLAYLLFFISTYPNLLCTSVLFLYSLSLSFLPLFNDSGIEIPSFFSVYFSFLIFPFNFTLMFPYICLLTFSCSVISSSSPSRSSFSFFSSPSISYFLYFLLFCRLHHYFSFYCFLFPRCFCFLFLYFFSLLPSAFSLFLFSPLLSFSSHSYSTFLLLIFSPTVISPLISSFLCLLQRFHLFLLFYAYSCLSPLYNWQRSRNFVSS